uniref:Uncharacterized protein n=1 Tax=Lepeophtheirus salmonis TaxID=72036 RepID=A0A0K2SZ40_LEPSM
MKIFTVDAVVKGRNNRLLSESRTQVKRFRTKHLGQVMVLGRVVSDGSLLQVPLVPCPGMVNKWIVNAKLDLQIK